jgi:hypothetical protein
MHMYTEMKAECSAKKTTVWKSTAMERFDRYDIAIAHAKQRKRKRGVSMRPPRD